MKAFYERHREELKTIYVSKQGPFLFPLHYHQNVEIFLLKQGEYVLSRNGEKHRVKDGAVVVFDSYDLHSYDEEISEATGYVIMFPPPYLESFSAWRGSKKIAKPALQDEALCKNLMQIADTLFYSPSERIRAAGAELFFALLEERLELTEKGGQAEQSLFQQILLFVQSHFKEDVSLSSVAHALGYTPTYISRVFHHYAKVGFPEYVNGLRLDYVERGRQKSGVQISDLIFEAGFKSAQTYYRHKAAQK